MSDFILRTEGLSKEFLGFTAVNRVNLDVQRGTIHALIGPNGAGKTTCFNLLTKFLTPTSGKIIFKDQDITKKSPAEIALIGMVRSFQISSVFPHLSVLENVRVGLQRRLGISMKFWRSEKTLESLNDEAMGYLVQVGLAEYAHKTAVNLPYGRKRALEIAISAGRTVLMVEHNMKVVSSIADTITVLQRGAVIASGTYAEVSSDPQVMEAYMGSAHTELASSAER